MRGPSYIIKHSCNWFGMYATQQEANERRKALSERGDSYGYRWPFKETRVVPVRETCEGLENYWSGEMEIEFGH
jgi:hypothetical protein